MLRVAPCRSCSYRALTTVSLNLENSEVITNPRTKHMINYLITSLEDELYIDQHMLTTMLFCVLGTIAALLCVISTSTINSDSVQSSFNRRQSSVLYVSHSLLLLSFVVVH